MTEQNDTPIIEFANVSKTFRSHRGMGELIPGLKTSDEVHALKDISFRLEKGRVQIGRAHV